ncbi:hypothetical protein Tco_1178605, partial [Tanacetum coccineum]
MPATPSPRSVNNTSSWIWCRSVILSVSSPNEPKLRVFPPNGIQEVSEDDDDVLNKLSLDSRLNVRIMKKTRSPRVMSNIVCLLETLLVAFCLCVLSENSTLR